MARLGASQVVATDLPGNLELLQDNCQANGGRSTAEHTRNALETVEKCDHKRYRSGVCCSDSYPLMNGSNW